MNFSDKFKDNFMNLPETEDDMEIAEESAEMDMDAYIEELNAINDKYMAERINRNLNIFLKLNQQLIDEGYEDKEERYRIIEIIF